MDISKQFQSSDFGGKLTSAQLKYCANDVIYLHKIHEELNKILMSFNDPIYKFRGLSGTHDVDLMYNCIQKLINGETTYIPTYDKSLNKGLGDRSGYIEIDFKPDIILSLIHI